MSAPIRGCLAGSCFLAGGTELEIEMGTMLAPQDWRADRLYMCGAASSFEFYLPIWANGHQQYG